MTLLNGIEMDKLRELKKTLKTDLLPLEMLYSAIGEKSLDAKKSYLKRVTQNGDLIRLKNGLYMLGEDYRTNGVNTFEIASLMLQPSYVSLESALSRYGLIPEGVYTTTSVTTKPSTEYTTPVGHFSYTYLKTSYFKFGFYQETSGPYKYLIATPLKALMDYIVLRQKHYTSVDDLEGDIRLDLDEFLSYKKFVNKEKIDEMLEIYKSHRLQVILKVMRKIL